MADKLPDVPGGPHLRTVAMPSDTNAGGDVFGGWTLSQMDLAGGGYAAERAHGHQGGGPPFPGLRRSSGAPERAAVSPRRRRAARGGVRARRWRRR